MPGVPPPTVYAHAIPQVTAERTGVHLLWSGPWPWVVSTTGWSIQRRPYVQHDPRLTCVVFSDTRLAALLADREARTPIGTVLYRDGVWPASGEPCHVYTLELTDVATTVRVRLGAPTVLTSAPPPPEQFTFGTREGRTVAGPVSGAEALLSSPEMDRVVVYARSDASVELCAESRVAAADEDADWATVPYLVRGLQLPLAGLQPGSGDLFAEAQARLFASESLDLSSFAELSGLLGTSLAPPTGLRPVDVTIELAHNADGSSQQMGGLDGLAMALVHPTWRRALGFAYFDSDPSLAVGATYEYRVSGDFPAADLADEIYGFHSIPTETRLPADFRLGSLRIRTAESATVEWHALGTAGKYAAGRRGIQLRPWQGLYWFWGNQSDGLDGWSAILDFARPVDAISLDLLPGPDLEFQARAPEPIGLAINGSVQAGQRAALPLGLPVTQVRLRGQGVLCGVRVGSGVTGSVTRAAIVGPVTLLDAPLPDPPTFLRARNLQQPRPAPVGVRPPEQTPHRPALGFELSWQPASRGGPVWPTDSDCAPALDAATFQIEHRGVDPPSKWEPVVADDNWTAGQRLAEPRDLTVWPRDDMLELYPESPSPPRGLNFVYRDTFDVNSPGLPPPRRPLPPLGTTHAYRVRSVDPVGRTSVSWTESAVVRLEKHLPPPVPVGLEDDFPDPRPTTPQPARPAGVFAETLVRGPHFDAVVADLVSRMPELTADESAAIRAATSNAIVLRWGWHHQQREADPFTTEFRVYVATMLDAVPGQLTSVTDVQPGVWDVGIDLGRAVAADAALGLRITAGYPYRVRSHNAGSSIHAIVEAALAAPPPAPGPVVLPLPWSPEMTRPPAWAQRVAHVPLTNAATYHYVLVDRLSLSAAHPRDTLWAGVSAADAESYVADQRPIDAADPLSGLAGNESAIVAAQCSARFASPPQLSVPAALGPVRRVVTDAPAGHPLRVDLDLAAVLPVGDLTSGEPVQVERVAAATVLANFDVTAGAVTALVPDARPDEPSSVPLDLSGLAPNDARGILDQLTAGVAVDVDDRYLVYLAAAHPFADRFFVATSTTPVPLGTFTDVLPASSGRWVYRVRRAMAGLRSAGAAVLPAVVRVPWTATGPRPYRETVVSAGGRAAVRMGVPLERGPAGMAVDHVRVTHLLMFARDRRLAVADPAQVVRIPNRPDLYPDGIAQLVRLRVGTDWLLPTVYGLSDPGVRLVPDPGPPVAREIDVPMDAPAGTELQVWACTLTEDAVPSDLLGPFRVAIPATAGG